MPKVDVIVPAFNAARFLSAALQSVVDQTFQDWRILLVDDGSTDATEQIASQFARALGPRMKLIQQENRGLSAARNTALRHSSAEFLAILDADDVWLPSRLEASVSLLESRPEVGLTYGRVSLIDSEGKVLGTPELGRKNFEGWIARGIYQRELYLPCPTISFRSKCIQDVGFFDETLTASEDRDLWLRIAQKYQVARVPGVIAHYRVSSGSMSSDVYRMLNAQKRMIDKHYGSPGCGFWSRRSALSNSYRELADILLGRNQPSNALPYALKALTFSPLNLVNWKRVAAVIAGRFTARGATAG